MSTENIVSIEITDAEKTALNDALTTIENTLGPKLIALTPEQRHGLPKMRDKTLPFVEKSLNYATDKPDFAPAYMQVPELQKDMDAVAVLTALLNRVEQLQSNLSDTIMLAGSEAYIAALAYYNSVKQAAKINVPDAKPIYEDLRQRFDR